MTEPTTELTTELVTIGGLLHRRIKIDNVRSIFVQEDAVLAIEAAIRREGTGRRIDPPDPANGDPGTLRLTTEMNESVTREPGRNSNPGTADVWYTPDCGHVHLSTDGTIYAVCPDGVTLTRDPGLDVEPPAALASEDRTTDERCGYCGKPFNGKAHSHGVRYLPRPKGPPPPPQPPPLASEDRP